jgi:preprotein translocase subunit SecY
MKIYGKVLAIILAFFANILMDAAMFHDAAHSSSGTQFALVLAVILFMGTIILSAALLSSDEQ